MGDRKAFPYSKILEKLPLGLHDQLVLLNRHTHTHKLKYSHVKPWCFHKSWKISHTLVHLNLGGRGTESGVLD